MRPGGYQRWTEVFAAQPGLRAHIYVDLTDVAAGELLDGIMHATGQLQEGFEPFETRFRVEFHDQADGRTRLEIRQWLPEHLAAPSGQGWLEVFTKLDAALTSAQAVAADQIADEHGAFDIFTPDDDVFAATTDLLRSVGTHL
ncbi:MAG: hypothetical protein ACRDZN_08320 [Acidimicrobiales bacterium]